MPSAGPGPDPGVINIQGGPGRPFGGGPFLPAGPSPQGVRMTPALTIIGTEIADTHGFSDGLRVRLTRVPGETPKGILRRRLYLPAVLGDQTIEELATFTDQLTHRAGEFSYPTQGGPGARMLRTFPLDFLTLDWEAPWLAEYYNPDKVVDELTAIIRSKRPVSVLALLRHSARARPTVFHANVTLRRLARTLRPGEADTRYGTLELKEWRATTGVRLTSESGKRASLPTTHILGPDDTLEFLSKKYYGSPRYWRTIANANGLRSWGPRTRIVKSSRFRVGSVIKIPKLPEAATVRAGGGGRISHGGPRGRGGSIG